MKVIKATQQMLETRTLVLGFQGENLRTQLRIDCSPTFAEYPNATPALAIKPPLGETYPVYVERDGNEVVWDIVANNLVLKGDGELQLTFYKDNVIAKTSIGHITVNRSLQIDGEMPDVVATWIENANRKLAEVDAQIVELEGMVDTATDAATRAEQSASTASTKAEQAAGSAATATEKATEATNAAGTATAKAAEAQTAAQTATEKANAAAESERIATAKAGEATTAAGTATTKAEQATEAAQTATEKAGDASASATAAHASEISAAESADDALSAEVGANAAKTAAEGSATQAGTSAQNAGTAAQTATQKATEAQQSATDAETFAGTATTKAEEAAASAQTASDAKTVVEQTAEQLAGSLEQIAQNTADIADHEQAYNALKAATLIHNTASGSIASFVDGAEMPVDEVTVQINPVQDLHGYDHPWPAGGGNNIWGGSKLAEDIGNASTAMVWDKTAKTIKIPINATPSKTVDENLVFTNGIVFEENTVYTLITDGTSAVFLNMMFKYTDGTTDRSLGRGAVVGAFQSASGKTVQNVVYRSYSGETVLNYERCGLFKGSVSVSAYTPYSNICPITGWDGVQIVVSPTTDAEDGQTYDITLPTEAGTVYGGELTVNADGSGSLVVDRATRTLDGTEPGWAINGRFDNPKRTYGYNKNSSMGEILTTTEIVSSYVPSAIFTGNDEVEGIYVDAGYLWIRTAPMAGMTAVVDWTTYLSNNPLQIVYKLTNPLTYSLTASQIRTLLGQNNVWADTGDVSVKYNADTKLYIDGKIAELVAQIVNS